MVQPQINAHGMYGIDFRFHNLFWKAKSRVPVYQDAARFVEGFKEGDIGPEAGRFGCRSDPGRAVTSARRIVVGPRAS